MAELSYLALGWGRQSVALACMMALDEIPRVDYLLHADTGHEMSGTYEYARRMTPWLGERGLTVVTVEGRRREVVVKDWGKRGDSEHTRVSIQIPAFTVANADPTSHGQTRRQCTEDWKIAPQRRFLNQELRRRGLKRNPGIVEAHMGISSDEYFRMRDSDVQYIVNRYPLIERRMTRRGCEAWLAAHDIPLPPKSACTFCPLHSRALWRKLKRAGGPDWQEAVAVDQAIRDRRDLHTLYVHPLRRPLPEAVEIPEDAGQLRLDEGPCDSGYCHT